MPHVEDSGPGLVEAVLKLFEDKSVSRVLGFRRGTGPLRSRAALASDAAQAEGLIFDVTCGNNLARQARKTIRDTPGPARLGVVAKGCDGRALMQYMAEGQLKREDVVIIGVRCPGVLDPRKVADRLEGADPVKWRVTGDKFEVETGKQQVVLALDDVLSDSCLRCRYPAPPVYDLLIGEGNGERRRGEEDEYAEVAEFENLGPDERWEWFSAQSSKCIRCYACRNACPMCYCEECFVDQTSPQWFGKSTELPDTVMFHLVRALHNAGRCVDCGACERACPLGVKLGLLNQRLEKEVRERFGYVAGLDPEEKPALAAFSEDDRQEFIL